MANQTNQINPYKKES